MPVENTTPNRGYQLPFGSNNLEDDVLRLIAALSAIDVDVAGLLVSVAQRALLVHSHVIADTTGLQAALDSKQDESEKGNANGYAALGADGKVPAAQLPSALFGSLSYQGTWNANTNTPTIPSASSANKGQYYKVATAGATNVSGITDWQVGDWVVSNGTAWDKVDNTEQVSSVAGLVGAISAASLKTALALTFADITGSIPDAKLPARLGPVAATITDWNNALDNGWYMGASVANAPGGSANWFLGYVEAHGSTGWRTQTVHSFTTDGVTGTQVYRRSQNNGTWEAWYLLQLSQSEQDARYVQPGAVALTGTPTAPTAPPGTNNTQIATTAFVAASAGTTNAAVQSASGAAVTFIGVPAGVKEITVMARGISTSSSGGMNLLLRPGTSAGVVATGYEGGDGFFQTASNTGPVTNGFRMGYTNNAAGTLFAVGKLVLMDAANNIWGLFATSFTSAGTMIPCGMIALPGVLDRLSFVDSSGVGFDAGTFNIAWSK